MEEVENKKDYQMMRVTISECPSDMIHEPLLTEWADIITGRAEIVTLNLCKCRQDKNFSDTSGQTYYFFQIVLKHSSHSNLSWEYF